MSLGANFRGGYLAQGQPLGLTNYQVNLTADNQNVLLGNVSRIDINSDNTTAANRTFTLESATLDGYMLLLTMVSGASTTCQLADSGNVLLSAAWEPLQGDALLLSWNQQLSAWVEVARSQATGLPDIPLASGNILVGNSGGLAASVAMSGDTTISNAGVVAIGANKVTSSMLATNVLVVTASGTLSQTDITGMNATPVTLLAAQGAGTLIVVDEIELLHTYSTAAYASGGDVSIQYETSATPISVLDVAVITATSTQNFILKPSASYTSSASTSSATDLSTSVNKAIQITNATGAFTSGNAANIFKYRLRYHVITLLT